MINKRLTLLESSNCFLRQIKHCSSESFVRRRSIMIFSDCRAALCKTRSMVILVLFPVGLLASQIKPFMKKSALCVFGVKEGGISSMFLPKFVKKRIVSYSCASSLTPLGMIFPVFIV